jgi:hypothetical protein
MTPFRHSLILSIGSSILLGCATAAQNSWTNPVGQRCSPHTGDSTHIDLTRLLSRSTAEVTAAAAGLPDTLLLSVSYDSTGALSGMRAFGRPGQQVDSATVDEVLRRRFVAEAGAKSHSHGLYVRGGEPDLRPHVVQFQCEPRLVNTREIRRQMFSLAAVPEARNRGIVAWLFVDADGRVTKAVIGESTGLVEIDGELLRIARMAEVAPALLDGFVVPAWVAIPLGIEVAPPPPRRGDCPPPEVRPGPCEQ